MLCDNSTYLSKCQLHIPQSMKKVRDWHFSFSFSFTFEMSTMHSPCILCQIVYLTELMIYQLTLRNYQNVVFRLVHFSIATHVITISSSIRLYLLFSRTATICTILHYCILLYMHMARRILSKNFEACF